MVRQYNRKSERRPGRANVIHTADTLPVRFDTQISSSHSRKLNRILEQRNMTKREWIEWNIDAQTLSKQEMEYSEVMKEYLAADTKATELKLRLRQLEEEKRVRETMEKALKLEERYPVRAFKEMMKTLLKANPYLKRFTATMDSVMEAWGIEFDSNALNEDFEEFLNRFHSNDFKDSELIKAYSIRRSTHNARHEKKIMSEIEKELGLT